MLAFSPFPASRRPTTGQEAPKIAPRRSKRPPRRLQERAPTGDTYEWTFRAVGPGRLSGCLKKIPQGRQEAPTQEAIRGPQRGSQEAPKRLSRGPKTDL
eukprot:1174390-Pyramimonas_sp.AAC.1